jgi:ATP-dependent DNA helicase RecG
LQILIGTHTLLEDKVKFQNLGLAVIDATPFWGRTALKIMEKKHHTSARTCYGATIPRTLAMSLYGDLDICY